MGEKGRALNVFHSFRATEWSENLQHNISSNLTLRNATSFTGRLPSQQQNYKDQSFSILAF